MNIALDVRSTDLHRKHALPRCKVLRTVPFDVALLAIIG